MTADEGDAKKVTGTNPDGDFWPSTAILTFGPNVTWQSFYVDLNPDGPFEETEYFVVRRFSPGSDSSDVGTGRLTATIWGNDSRLSFEQVSETVGEEVGTNYYRVKRYGYLGTPVTVGYFTQDGTAKVTSPTNPAGDYPASSGTLRFPAVSGSGPRDTAYLSIPVPILNDSQREPEGDVPGPAPQPSAGATLASPWATTVTIADNDSDFRFGPAQAPRYTEGVQRVEIPVHREWRTAPAAGRRSGLRSAGSCTGRRSKRPPRSIRRPPLLAGHWISRSGRATSSHTRPKTCLSSVWCRSSWAGRLSFRSGEYGPTRKRPSSLSRRGIPGKATFGLALRFGGVPTVAVLSRFI